MPSSSPNWIADALDRLAKLPCGYHVGDPSAAEPIALAALALLGADRPDDARNHLHWLATSGQKSDGSVAPYESLQWPGWSTPLAIIVAVFASHSDAAKTLPTIDLAHAKSWLVAAEGKTLGKTPEFGHDGMLVGWPWVLGTHSWQEPTAWSVLALRSLGLSDHPRTREGVRLLIDRLLPEGGCNYGNTYVLGQKLRAQVEPTGLAMLALAGEPSDDLRIAYSLQFLTANLLSFTTPISLAYGLLGLCAHQKIPSDSAAWLESAYRQTLQREPAPLPIALLTLAAQGNDCLLLKIGNMHPRETPT
ncbi:MAG TPA: hypothetical protein VGI75_09700 [Pirellulales bacterium]|jgi:hypothetical protein